MVSHSCIMIIISVLTLNVVADPADQAHERASGAGLPNVRTEPGCVTLQGSSLGARR